MHRFILITVFLVLISVGTYAQEVKILLMGDMQKIIDQQSDRFLTTMDKILTDSNTNDAAFILQMGDIVETDADNSDRPQQYALAQKGWRKLDGKIPYVLNLEITIMQQNFSINFP